MENIKYDHKGDIKCESRSFDGAFIETWKMHQEEYDNQKIRAVRAWNTFSKGKHKIIDVPILSLDVPILSWTKQQLLL